VIVRWEGWLQKITEKLTLGGRGRVAESRKQFLEPIELNRQRIIGYDMNAPLFKEA